MTRIVLPLLLIVGIPDAGFAQTPADTLRWELGPTGTKVSLRGLSAASDSVVWACGSNATVLRSGDGGSSWLECGPDRFGELEFRSIHAFSASTAVIASAGTPAVVCRTENGGSDWREVYRNDSPQAFFDALRFWDDLRGLAFSDPVDGQLLVVETDDSGQAWKEIPDALIPDSNDGEAAFAASNSSLALGPAGMAWIGTGGANLKGSRIYVRQGWGGMWSLQTCPLRSSPTEGIFSIAIGHRSAMAIVGGDYRPEAVASLTAAFSSDRGVHWQPSKSPPDAYRSAVIDLPYASTIGSGFIATGPTGSDFSVSGDSWQRFSDDGFHVLARSRNKVFAAGSNGRFAVLRNSLPEE